MALWLKRLSNLRLSALELACSELQDRGCKPIQADSRKTSRLTWTDYSRGILAWVRLLFFQHLICTYQHAYSVNLRPRNKQILMDTSIHLLNVVTSLILKKLNRFVPTLRLWLLRPGSPQFQVNCVLLVTES